METQRSNGATISYCPVALLSSASYVRKDKDRRNTNINANTKGTTREREKTNAETVQCNGCEIISHCPVVLLIILTLICPTNTDTNTNANEKNRNASTDNYRVEREWNLKC